MKSKTTALSKNKPRGCSPSDASLLLDTPEPLRLSLGEYEGVNIALVGCGGTGSHLASGLGALACELRERKGLNVGLVFVDPDRVEPKNIGRQLFTSADVGKYKAHVLAQRITTAYRLPVDALAEPLAAEHLRAAPFRVLNLVIGAVDNDAARRVIHRAVDDANGNLWWLDNGNESHSGQVVLGNTTNARAFKHAIELGMTDRAPALSLVHPEFLAAPKKTKQKNMSCAELAAAGEQGLMVNRLVAAWALSLLNDFLLTRELRFFGMTFDARWGNTKPYAFDLPTLSQVTGLTATQLSGETA